jgi:sulfur relay (sulfurtransferase) DsrF/TusC family protein
LGVSEAFLLLLKDINIDDSVYAVVPYQQPQSVFKNEVQAYQCFQDYGGIDAYIERLKQLLKCNLGKK